MFVTFSSFFSLGGKGLTAMQRQKLNVIDWTMMVQVMKVSQTWILSRMALRTMNQTSLKVQVNF